MKSGDPIRHLAERFRLCDVYAFGSRAREAVGQLRSEKVQPTHPKSDMDIGVRLRPGATLGPSDRVQLAFELEDLLGVSRVDLVLLEEADPFLAVEIIRGELLHAGDLDSQARYELHVLRRAGDLLPFKKERIRMVLEEGAR